MRIKGENACGCALLPRGPHAGRKQSLMAQVQAVEIADGDGPAARNSGRLDERLEAEFQAPFFTSREGLWPRMDWERERPQVRDRASHLET